MRRASAGYQTQMDVILFGVQIPGEDLDDSFGSSTAEMRDEKEKFRFLRPLHWDE